MARRGRPRHPDILTPREWDVLALLRERLTNEQIAQRLEITERTAKFHVSEILSKLGVGNREEAAAWQPEAGRAWWLAASAPFAFLWRRVAETGLKAFEIAIGTALVAGVAAGIALLAVMLSRGGGGQQASVTPGEPRIAFSVGGNIYTVRPDGTGLRKVIPGDRETKWNAAPAFSPDGSRIAFTRNYDIWIANSDGSEAHRLADVASLQDFGPGADSFSTGAQSIAWSPDGRHIAYVLSRIGGSGVQDVWVMRDDGSERVRLYQGGAGWLRPIWLDGDRVSVVEGNKILVFNVAGRKEPAITFLDSTRQSSLVALPVVGEEWLVGPPTAQGPITLGSIDAGRKTVATGISPTLAPGGAAFAYLWGDTLHVAEIGGSADELILYLAPLGGRDRFFGEPGLCFNTSSQVAPPACSYRLPAISWTGSPEANARYVPATVRQYPGLGIELKEPGSWIEGAPQRTYGGFTVPSCLPPRCTVLGPANPAKEHGVMMYTEDSSVVWCNRNPLRPCGGLFGINYQLADHQGTFEDAQHTVTVAGQDAVQLELLRIVPVGVTNATGETTPDHHVWTGVPMGDGTLVLVAFWRDGDAAGEQETRAGYDVILKSLRFVQ